MKFLLLSFALVVSGCQAVSTEPLPKPSVSEPPAAAPAHTASPENTETQATLLRQRQWIEALISQNEALARKLAAGAASASVSSSTSSSSSSSSSSSPSASASASTSASASVAAILATSQSEEMSLVPDREGVIDLAAISADTNANPFVVRTAGSARELTLAVSGVVTGAAQCAVINERLVQPGESVDVLRLERVEPDGVMLAFGERRLRMRVGEKPVRVRLPN